MKVKPAKYWDEFAKRWSKNSCSDKLWAEHKIKTYLNLLARWAEVTYSQRILKTDLFAEASDFGQFLFELAKDNGNIVGIDISNEIVKQAKRSAERNSVAGEYICCDVRQLPLRSESIDLIISDSTLDHFPDRRDIIAALQELRRVLRVGGTLILTIDNKANLTYPPYIFIRVWMLLRLAPYFIGKTLSPNELRRALEEIGFRVEESTAILHYPHPAALVPLIERFLHWLGKGKLDSAFRKSLTFLDKLEGKRTKYLTGRYIAAKAVKV